MADIMADTAVEGSNQQAATKNATVKRHLAPSGNHDNDYFQPLCPACGWAGAHYSNRTVEGRTVAERHAAQHRCPTSSPETVGASTYRRSSEGEEADRG